MGRSGLPTTLVICCPLPSGMPQATAEACLESGRRAALPVTWIAAIDRLPLVVRQDRTAAPLHVALEIPANPSRQELRNLLAQAVTEESVRVVQVIGNAEGLAQASKEASGSRGYAVACDANAIRGMQSLLVNPGTDVVVIQEILADGLPEDVINNIKKHEFSLRSAMLDVMRQTTEAETAKPEFRKELALKLKDVMNSMLEEYEDFGGIEEVMFTSFVMQ